MLNYRFLLVFLFLIGCTEEKSTPKIDASPQNKEYSLQDMDTIYKTLQADKQHKKRLADHKNLKFYDEFSNTFVEKSKAVTTAQQPKNQGGEPASDLLEMKQPAPMLDMAKSVKPKQSSKRDKTAVETKFVKRSTDSTMKNTKEKQDTYMPIIIGASAQQSVIERWGKAEKKHTKKNIRAGHRVTSELTQNISSSDHSPTIFKVTDIQGEYRTYANITISCDYRYNPSTQRMNFKCRHFESEKHQINISAEVLDKEGNKGLLGRVIKKKIGIVESATYAGLQGAIKQIGSSNPVQSALQAGLTAGVKKPQVITKEILHVNPQPVIIHFLNSF